MRCAVSLANTNRLPLSNEMKITRCRWLVALAIGLTVTYVTACGAQLRLTEAPSSAPVVSRLDETVTSTTTVEEPPNLAQIVEATSQPIPETGGALTGLEALTLAWPSIRDWKADAQLLELGTTIMAPIAPDGTCTAWTASFYSASAQAIGGVTIQNGRTVVTAEIPTQYEAGQSIDPALVKLDSDEAMRIARENGGGEYSAQEDILAVAVLNYHVASQNVVWVINYQNPADYANVFTIYMDAVTGKVLR